MKKKTPWFELVMVIAVVAVAIILLRGSQQPGSSTVLPEDKPSSVPAAASSSPTPTLATTITETATPASASQSTTAASPKPTSAAPLTPIAGKSAPSITEVKRVKISTSTGDVIVEVYPQAAPNGAKRFLELVKLGFYDNTAVSRVVKDPQPFVAQFGINPRMADWKEKNFDDDPTLFELQRGTLCFAKAGLNNNSTQVFINLAQNDYLADPSMNFTVFGKVVKGMDHVDAFLSVGDPSGGLDQNMLWSDPDYLKTLDAQPTMITAIKVL